MSIAISRWCICNCISQFQAKEMGVLLAGSLDIRFAEGKRPAKVIEWSSKANRKFAEDPMQQENACFEWLSGQVKFNRTIFAEEPEIPGLECLQMAELQGQLENRLLIPAVSLGQLGQLLDFHARWIDSASFSPTGSSWGQSLELAWLAPLSSRWITRHPAPCPRNMVRFYSLLLFISEQFNFSSYVCIARARLW